MVILANKIPISGHLMRGFLPKSSDKEPAIRAKNMDGTEPFHKRN